MFSLPLFTVNTVGPLSEILTIANLWHAASRVWTCAEPEFRLSWMKFSSSDNHYTMAPLNYKFSLVSTIFFTIFSEMPKFYQGIWKIKDIFIRNGYSESFIDKYVKAFLSKVFIAKWPLFYLLWVLSRLNLNSNYIKCLSDCYQPVTWEWYLDNFENNGCNAEYIGKAQQHYRLGTSKELFQKNIFLCFSTQKYVKSNSQIIYSGNITPMNFHLWYPTYENFCF